MAENDITPKRRRSKAPRGGRYTLDPEPQRQEIAGQEAAGEALVEFLTTLDERPSPADLMARQMADLERVARDCLADDRLPDGDPARHWAQELLNEIRCWRSSTDPADRELAAFRAGGAWALLQAYARAAGKHRKPSKEGSEVNAANADARMNDLKARLRKLDAEGKIPNSYRCKPAIAVKALEADGWASPWLSADWTRRKVSEALQSLRPKKKW